jgi:hypothetical protein
MEVLVQVMRTQRSLVSSGLVSLMQTKKIFINWKVGQAQPQQSLCLGDLYS